MDKLMMVVFLATAGCSAEKLSLEDEPIDVASDLKSDLWKTTQFLGNFAPPRAIKGIPYHNPKKYRSYSFTEAAGKNVDIRVGSSDGDAVAWLFDYKGKLIRYNDDADKSTTDAHIHVKLPPSNGFYYVYFREYSMQDCTFQFGVSTAYDSGLVGDAEKTYNDHADNLAPYQVAKSKLPAKAQTTWDKWATIGAQYPLSAYALPVDGQTVYVVAQVGEEVYWLDLYDAKGTLLTHGADGDGGPSIALWGPAPTWDPTGSL